MKSQFNLGPASYSLGEGGGSADFFILYGCTPGMALCSFAICAGVFCTVLGFAFTAGAAAFRPSKAVPPAAAAPRDCVSEWRLLNCRAAWGCAGFCTNGLVGAAATL